MGRSRRNRDDDDDSSGTRRTKRNFQDDIDDVHRRLSVVLWLLIIVIIMLAANIYVSLVESDRDDDAAEGPFIDPGDGLEIDVEEVETYYTVNSVELSLENTGDERALVGVSGVVYISEMGSAEGEEATAVLEYQYVEIEPGESEDLRLGTFNQYDDWHYVVEVHIGWNGGSIVLTELLVPSS